eukprot:9635-Heterococcus_DN1.PRE.2
MHGDTVLRCSSEAALSWCILHASTDDSALLSRVSWPTCKLAVTSVFAAWYSADLTLRTGCAITLLVLIIGTICQALLRELQDGFRVFAPTVFLSVQTGFMRVALRALSGLLALKGLNL